MIAWSDSCPKLRLASTRGLTTPPTSGCHSVGGSIETAVADRTTFNLVYRYSDYGTEDFDVIGFEVDPSAHTVRAGLKCKLM
ncbi:Outer membrane protein [Nitratireductor basaltis]|uniref:Outer membrane protein n=1 Tax=Nitratireductor basaltis TaxID=472175 RepID=A0A084U4Z8_9HYPH|nr:Outer membrane protein [Nitratireductor basaltis]